MKHPIVIGSLTACLILTTLVIPGSAALPWPDTRARIGVFVDQLPGNLTSAQREFAATNLAGTQKLLRSEIRALRAINPGFLCLHYQLGVGCGTSAFVVGDQWGSDWAFVNSQSNWFLFNPAGQRIHQTEWNWDLMDITYTNRQARTGFPEYWISNCLARIRATESDGVFADSFTPDAYTFGQCNPTHPWLEDVDLCLANWVPNLFEYGSAIRQAFEQDASGLVFLPNLGGLINTWNEMDYGFGHGGMIEGFCFWQSDQYLELGDWQLQMERALNLVRRDKILICQTYANTSAYRDRLFATASYLLVKGNRTYLNLLTTDAVALEYYPEYTLDLGPAIEPTAATLSNLWNSAWGVYRRDFSNGVVLVNPGDGSIAITNLGAVFRRVSATGGGPVDAQGHYNGNLSLTPVTSLNLAAHSGEILFLGGGSGTNQAGDLPAQPASVTAFHRSGQTFVTWSERGDLSAESYVVYRHSSPINTTNLSLATRLYQVWEGSANFYANRYADDNGNWRARYLDRLVITNKGEPLPAGAGLLVWTLATNDFGGGTTGSFFYAITTVNPEGVENTRDFSPINVIGPVAEGIADPLPVEAAVNLGPRGHLFIQYMNLREWNPTFHAPQAANGFYGLDSSSPAVIHALQYAYDYVVYEPESPTSLAPVVMSLHGWGGNTYGPVLEDPDPWGWNVYKIYPVDQGETWYFGFARHHDYRLEGDVETGDTIVNYTEQRLLRMIYDLWRNPPREPVDTNRFYVYGQSMGGSGTLALALRYPNVFAAAYASEPMTDYAASGDGGGMDWRDDVSLKWGARTLNLPVGIDGPGGWANTLKRYNGQGVWDWQNHRANAASRVADEIVPLGIAHGTNDMIIEWPTQGRPVYAAFNQSRRTWGGMVTDADHTWLGFAGLPPTMGTDDFLTPFAGFGVVRNETVPGLSNGSADAPLPPTGPGNYNQALLWSSSWTNWDTPPVDTATAWQISLRTLNNTNQAVDVTPRRTQAFRPQPGRSYQWKNTRISDGTVIQNGLGVVEASGLVTVSGVRVEPTGNRLRIELATDGLRILLARRNGSNIELAFSSVAGMRYRIEQASALPGGSWSLAADNLIGTGDAIPFTLAITPGQGRGFYRVVGVNPMP